MADRNLLARLDRAAPHVDTIHRRTSPSAVEQSIIDNLRCLFQVRQGNSQSAPRCGIPDFSGWFLLYSNPGNRLRSAIKEMIEEFEPRLRDVRVEQQPELRPGALRFEITASFELPDAGETPFRVQTVMARLDHFSVERA